MNFRFNKNEEVNEDHASKQTEDVGKSDHGQDDDFNESGNEEVDVSATVDMTSDGLNLQDEMGGATNFLFQVPGHDIIW